MAKHNVSIILSDDEEKFLKWIRKDGMYGRDEKLTVNQVLMRMLSLQLREDMDLYFEEMEISE